MSLRIQLVTYNGAKYIPYLFASLKKQTFIDWELFILDNASQDSTYNLMQAEAEKLNINISLEPSQTNLGFAAGHNKLFLKNNATYTLILNQDIYLAPNCLEKIIKYLDENKNIAGVSPRLMKWDFEKISQGLESSFTNIVDSFGLKVYKNRRVVDLAASEKWNNNHQNGAINIFSVFGLSCAASVFRTQALKEVAFENGDLFDADYINYKEDVDLAYRLAICGDRVCVLSETVAYHNRTAPSARQNPMSVLSNKQKQPDYVKYHSYKNHLMTIYKNEYWQNLTLDFLSILCYEIIKFVYYLFYSRFVLTGLSDIWKMRNSLAEKKRFIKSKRKISWLAMRRKMFT